MCDGRDRTTDRRIKTKTTSHWILKQWHRHQKAVLTFSFIPDWRLVGRLFSCTNLGSSAQSHMRDVPDSSFVHIRAHQWRISSLVSSTWTPAVPLKSVRMCVDVCAWVCYRLPSMLMRITGVNLVCRTSWMIINTDRQLSRKTRKVSWCNQLLLEIDWPNCSTSKFSHFEINFSNNYTEVGKHKTGAEKMELDLQKSDCTWLWLHLSSVKSINNRSLLGHGITGITNEIQNWVKIFLVLAHLKCRRDSCFR